MKILILGAAGQIGRILADYLLQQTEHQLVLYARNVAKRLKLKDENRETFISGDFLNYDNLLKAMRGVDFIYLNDMNNKNAVHNIIKSMKESGVSRITVASILGIYDEVAGAFGEWNRSMVGDSGIQRHKETAALIEKPEFDYTILRLSWLYNEEGKRDYLLTKKGEPFMGAQVTRESVAQLVIDIIEDSSGQFIQKSLGVGEPNTEWDKPSFY